jgi:hypothetical protein
MTITSLRFFSCNILYLAVLSYVSARRSPACPPTRSWPLVIPAPGTVDQNDDEEEEEDIFEYDGQHNDVTHPNFR